MRGALAAFAFAILAASLPSLVNVLVHQKPAFGCDDLSTVLVGVFGQVIPSLLVLSFFFMMGGNLTIAVVLTPIGQIAQDINDIIGSKADTDEHISMERRGNILAMSYILDVAKAVTAVQLNALTAVITAFFMFFATAVVYALLASFSIIPGGIGTPEAAVATLCALVLGYDILKIVAGCVSLSELQHTERSKLVRTVRAKTVREVEELLLLGDDETAGSIAACIPALDALHEQVEVYDLQVRIFGVKLNMGTAQKLAAAMLGSIAAILFRVVIAGSSSEE